MASFCLCATAVSATSVLDQYRSGDVRIIAGQWRTASFGGDGGPASLAAFEHPEGIHVDTNGDIYIADYGNHRIRKIDSQTGIISTVAGNGIAAFAGDGSQATQASLFYPGDVYVANGELYIVEKGNHRVRKVDTQGIISTIAGGGVLDDGVEATLSALLDPKDVVVAEDGTVYIAESGRVRKVDPTTHIISTFAGTGVLAYSGDGGPATEAELTTPVGLALGIDGTLYLSFNRGDIGIRRIDTQGTITAFVAGHQPRGLALDQDGNLYIADQNSVILVDPSGNEQVVLGDGTSDPPAPVSDINPLNVRDVSIGPDGSLYFLEADVLLKIDDAFHISTPDIFLSTTSLSFGDVTADQSATQTFTVSNNGNADLSVTGIRSSGPTRFTASPSCGARGRWDFDLRTACTLTPGSSQNVTVTFTPQSYHTGFVGEVIIIQSNDPDQPYIELSVSGDSVLPKLVIEDVSDSARIDDIQNNGYTFEQPMQVGKIDSVGIGIHNGGNADLQVSDLVFSNWEGSWNISDPNYSEVAQPFVVQPGETVNVSIFWSPTVPGPAHGTFTILSNDFTRQPSLVLDLHAVPGATGIVAAAPDIALSAWSLNFGDVTVGQASSQSFTVSNTGNADLTVTGISSSDGQFTLSPSSLTVGAGASANVTVTFTPSAAGTRSGNLTVTSNDPDEGSVMLLSFGIALPEVVTPPPEISLGSTVVDVLAAQGSPNSVTDIFQGTFWYHYGQSRVDFRDGLVVGYNNKGELNVRLGGPLFGATFKIGDSPSQVVLAQGTPRQVTSIATGTFWYHYGQSRVDFRDGLVVGYNNEAELNVHLGGAVVGAVFDISDMPAQVILAQGTPGQVTSISAGTFWYHYGESRVDFRGGIVVGYNDKGELHVHLGDAVVGTSFRIGDSPRQVILAQGTPRQVTSISLSTFWYHYGQSRVDLRDGLVTGFQDDGNLNVATVASVPEIRLSPSVIGFGDTEVGGSDTMPLTISNDGLADLVVASITTSLRVWSVPDSSFTIDPDSALTVVVTFSPTTIGRQSGTVSVSSNDPDNRTVVVPISGNAVVVTRESALTIAPDSLIFGTVGLGDERTLKLTLTNTTSGDVSIARFFFEDDTQFFAISSVVFPFLIPRGLSKSFFISFRPVVSGNQNSTISINTEFDTLSVVLIGDGIGTLNSGRPTARITAFPEGPVLWSPDASVLLVGDAFDNDQNGQSIDRFLWLSSLDDTLSLGTETRDFQVERAVKDWTIGTHELTFRVWDNEGDSSDATALFEVVGLPPVAQIDSAAINGTFARTVIVREGLDEIDFFGSGIDSDEFGSSINARAWTFRSEADSYTIERSLGDSSILRLPPETLGSGRHRIYYQVTDDEGEKSKRDSVQVTVRGRFGRAVIVAGGDLELRVRYSSEAANRVYDTLFSKRRFERDDIVYLNTIDWGPHWQNVNVTDNDVSVNRLHQEIENARSDYVERNVPLLIFLAGHGGLREFQLAKGEILKAEDLRTWVDALVNEKAAIRGISPESLPADEIVVVVDFCFSRTFLQVISGPGRVVIGSSSNERASVIDGTSFASSFFRWLSRGGNEANLWRSFEEARQQVQAVFSQAPYMDVDGDGIGLLDENGNITPGQESGVDLSRRMFVGGEIGGRAITLGVEPEVYSLVVRSEGRERYVFESLGDPGLEGLTMSFAIVGDDDGLPAPGAPGTGELVALQQTRGDTIVYQGEYTFEGSGDFTVIILAKDGLGNFVGQLQERVTISLSSAGDFDGDGRVGFGDFILFAQNFGHTSTNEAWSPAFDLNDDGSVGFGDFIAFAALFGS